MTTEDGINNSYFEWMSDIVCEDRYSVQISYRKLLMSLHSIVFRYSMSRDANRADDGIDLRYRFAYEHPDIKNAELYLKGPCSVLEMMVALAIRCEESIMDDPSIGDRTSQWFWIMVSNLGLNSMTDSKFDKQYVKRIISRFLNREYDPDGTGGLFIIKDCQQDLRTVEIWYQLCWYLDRIV